MFYSETLPKSPGSAAQARDLLRRVSDQLPANVLDDARLLISELVANAVEHVVETGEIGVSIAFNDGVLRVEVRDPGPGFEFVERAGDAGASDRGWGLVFVNRVASRWSHGPGCVWFELGGS
jgi:anti-sigma regulatory factor (Ser/Thr protein kinase)